MSDEKKDSLQHINIKVVAPDQSEVFFKIKRTTPAGGGVFGDLVAATQIAPPPDAGHMVAAGPDSHHSPPHPMLGFGASPEHASGDFGAAASQNRDVQYLFHIVDPSLPKRRRGVPGPPRPPQLAGTLATAPSIESSLPLYSGSSSIDSGIGTAAGASSGGSASMLSSLQHLSMDLRKHPRAQPVNYHRRGDPRYKFECELCGRVFRRKLGLTSHMPMHTGERIYRCNLHHKTHDKANQQKCHYCQRMFQRKDALDRHLKSTTNRGCSMELRRSIGEADQSSPASAGIM
nr:hypothetical protein HK105_002891 [Polyrhizophydium stewartii]